MERSGEVRLLVRGIAKGVSVTELADLFAPYGGDPERIALPRDRRTRRRKGIAYVFVPSARHAADAIGRLDNTELAGKTITLEAAAERPSKRRRFGGSPSGPGPRSIVSPAYPAARGGIPGRPGVTPRPPRPES